MKTKEKYLERAKEYKRKNKERIKEQRKGYDIQYYKNLSEEQKEKRRVYNKEYNLKNQKPKPIKEPKPLKVKIDRFQLFLNNAKNKHGERYDYSLVEYVKSSIKVKIICPEHGIFEQRPNDHLYYGCGMCGGTKKLTTDDAISKFKDIHGERYDYSLVEYVNSASNVKIICPEHGIFEQKPNNHLMGKGCKKCGVDYGVWSYSIWEEKGLKSNKFDSFKLYVIECWDSEEHFFKIGKTFRTINSRFKGEKFMPYDYKVINIIEGDSKYISELEQEYKKKYKEKKYLPKKEFNGRYECYTNLELVPHS
jgi:hypothetical protein